MAQIVPLILNRYQSVTPVSCGHKLSDPIQKRGEPGASNNLKKQNCAWRHAVWTRLQYFDAQYSGHQSVCSGVSSRTTILYNQWFESSARGESFRSQARARGSSASGSVRARTTPHQFGEIISRSLALTTARTKAKSREHVRRRGED